MRKETWFFYFLFFKKGEGNEWFWMLSEDLKKKKKEANMSISLVTENDKIKGGKASNEKWSATSRGIFDSLFPWASPLPSEKTF